MTGAGLAAIDVHVHAEAKPMLDDALDDDRLVDAIADHYRTRRMRCVLFVVGPTRHPLHRQASNEAVLNGAKRHPDVITPLVGIDPHGGPAEQARLEAWYEQGAAGVKLHPILQEFRPDDEAHSWIWDTTQRRGGVALLHTGQTSPKFTRSRLRFGDPLPIDDVAAEYPDLKIVMAHPSFPWQDIALSIAVGKPNVYIDLSGWSPKYFPEQLIRYAGSLLQDKVLFGSDFPHISPDRWITDFQQAPFKDEAREKILVGNAARLFGLAE